MPQLTLTTAQIYRLILPFARVLFRGNIPIDQAYEELKRAYVEVAKQELLSEGERINPSRLNVMTGLYRRDIKRLLADVEPEEPTQNLATRILAQWENDRQFCSKNGQPRTLTAGFKGSEFWELVLKVNRDIHPGTVLFELERTGYVQRTARGAKLVRTPNRLPAEKEQSFKFVTRNVDLLLRSSLENLESGSPVNLNMRTEFDNIPQESVVLVQKWLRREGEKLHRRVRAFLSGHDRDLSGQLEQDGTSRAKVSFSSFSCSEPSRSTDEV